MDYRPNIDAVRWFATDILPRIGARHPSARFAIVGRAPTEEVRALEKLPGVTVTGEVPDVRPWLAAADAVVAPLLLARSEEHTSELQSLMRNSYAVYCLKKKKSTYTDST